MMINSLTICLRHSITILLYSPSGRYMSSVGCLEFPPQLRPDIFIPVDQDQESWFIQEKKSNCRVSPGSFRKFGWGGGSGWSVVVEWLWWNGCPNCIWACGSHFKRQFHIWTRNHKINAHTDNQNLTNLLSYIHIWAGGISISGSFFGYFGS